MKICIEILVWQTFRQNLPLSYNSLKVISTHRGANIRIRHVCEFNVRKKYAVGRKNKRDAPAQC